MSTGFNVFRDGIVNDPGFQAACQRYAHANGSSEAIVMAVLTATGFPELLMDAMRYRHLRDHHGRYWTSNIGGGDTCDFDFTGSGHDIDAAVDAAMAVAS